jgi:hypothetical protein
MSNLPLLRWEKATLLAALGLGTVLRLAFLQDFRASLFFEHPVLDSLEYLMWAREIQAGHPLWDQVPIHSPLYAFFLSGLLSIFDDSLGLVRMTQALGVGLVNCLVLWALARRCAGRLAASVSVALGATLWPLVYHDGELLVESLVLLLNGLALLTLIHARLRPRWLALGGAFLGLSIVARPNAVAFLPVAALWAAWPPRGTRDGSRSKAEWRGVAIRFAAVLLGAAIFIFPVVARNHALSGAWMVQANGWLNFYIGNNADANGTPNVRPGRPWAQLNDMASNRGFTTPSHRDDFYRKLALRWWREEPGRAAALLVKKIFLFWNAYETRASLDIYYFRRISPALSLPWPGFGILAPLALLGVAAALLRRSRENNLLLLYTATYTFATAAFVVSGRYRLPVVAAAIPLAGYATARVVSAVRQGPRRLVAVGIALTIVIGVAVRQVPGDVIVRENAAERYNLGTILINLKRYSEAEAVLRAAWEERRDDGRIAVNLGVVLINTGRTRESFPIFQRAVELYPESAEAWNNLGAVAAELGFVQEAMRAYRKSIELSMENPIAHLGYGLFLLERGDREGALKHLSIARRQGAVLPSEVEVLLSGAKSLGQKNGG